MNKPSEERRWLKYFRPDVSDDTIPRRTIYQELCDSASKHSENTAIFYYGNHVSYKQLVEYVDRVAASFVAMGIKKDDIVSFVMPTTPESICCMYAINKIGAISNFIDPRMSVDRIYDAASVVKSSLIVTIDVAYHKVKQIVHKLNVEKVIVSSARNKLPPVLHLWQKIVADVRIHYNQNVLRWRTFVALGKGTEVAVSPYRADVPAIITYTGGTTGTPKGVLLTDDGINAVAYGFGEAGFEYDVGDKFLEIMPIFSSYGVGCGIHTPLHLGLEMVVIPKFKPTKLGNLIKTYHPNHMIAVPSFYERIMNARCLRKEDLSFLRSTGCGGDTMNDELERQFNEFLHSHGAKYCLTQGYGMSEMSGAVTYCSNNVYKDGSSGVPMFATVVSIFHPETGEEMGYNELGEICMRGRNMMLGYYNNPEETATVIKTHADGTKWVHSGDIGYIDEDGFVFIKGRIKQIIIRFDGHKVFPVTIESILSENNSVASCAVVGIKDPYHAQGEVPLGIVELKNSSELDDSVKDAVCRELLDYCNKVCEERGKPIDIVWVDKMMYTGLGKHDYSGLKKLFEHYKPNKKRK